jgi:hypothetical protein
VGAEVVKLPRYPIDRAGDNALRGSDHGQTPELERDSITSSAVAKQTLVWRCREIRFVPLCATNERKEHCLLPAGW